MNWKNVIEQGQLIYQSQETDDDATFRNWTLKKSQCNVSYYEIFPLDDIDRVICTILTAHNGEMEECELATILGFNVKDDFNAYPKRYADVAELQLFKKIVQSVFDWGLISKSDSNLYYLTELGRRSIDKNEKYKFFNGKKILFENFGIKTNNQEENDYFPFLSEFNICSEITNRITINYGNIDIQLFEKEDTDLIRRMNFQSKQPYNIYMAEVSQYFDIVSEKVDFKLYLFENQYYPIVFSKDSLCIVATNLLNSNINVKLRDLKIEWGLYLRMMKDPNAVLDYNTLSPFKDILDLNKIIPDNRLVWQDERLFNFLSCYDDANLISLISKHCPTEIIQKHINDADWDWIVLSNRMEGDFICQHPSLRWDFEIVSSRDDITKEAIKSLLLLPALKETEWNWDNIMPKLDLEFIKRHIGQVDFDLNELTKNESVEIQYLISSSPASRWNWKYISDNYDLAFILDNIHKFVYYDNTYQLNRLNLKTIIERAFSSEEYCKKYCSSSNFENTLKICNVSLRDFSANNADYIWTYPTIDFSEKNGLLTWASGFFKDGFECNPYVEWTEEYFNHYNTKVSTGKGFSFVSQSITLAKIVFDNPNFNWDWNALSSNRNLIEDEEFIKHYISKFDLGILLPNLQTALVESLLTDFGLVDLLSDNAELWSIVTEKVSVEFVRKYLDFSWNWKILTRRFYSTININALGNERWVDKWDWQFLTHNLNWNVVYDNLDKYCKYWDWEFLIDSHLSNSEILVSAHRISTLDEKTQKKMWKKITSKFDVAELIDLIHKTNHLVDYKWDYEYFYALPKLDILSYIENYTSDVKWHELSKSPQLNEVLQWDTLYSKDFWIKTVIRLLQNENYKWDFSELSKLESINSRAKFLSVRTKEWDWQYLTANSLLFKTGNYFTKVFDQFINYIDFPVLSARQNSGVTQELISKYADKFWDWAALSQNTSIMFDIDFIKGQSAKPWDWNALTVRNDIAIDNNSLYELIDKDWDWQLISNRKDIEFDTVFVEKLSAKDLNWLAISREISFVPNQKTLSILKGKTLDWVSISKNPKLDNAVLWDYRDMLVWEFVTKSKIDCNDTAQLEKYKDYIDWNVINQCDSFKIDNDIIEKFGDVIDWNKASQSRDIDFTDELIEKYRNKWNWLKLSENPRVKDKVDAGLSKYKSELNCIQFIKRFPIPNPCVYHFTHLFNAVEIIKSRKIMSRNKAEGKFANAAGNLVDRRSTAHAFARFYYRPQTPTQFYNECLGWDSSLQTSWGKSYYDNACRLGLPKCPMPVFFKFDLEEVISKMSDKCYFSTGNMQTNSAVVQKVVENPNGLNTDYVYYNFDDGFEYYKMYSQQEFLVLNELDFSNLKSFEIICYNKDQAEILKNQLEGDCIINKITTNGYGIFHRNNRQINVTDTDSVISISANYHDNAHFKFICDDTSLIDIRHTTVLKETSNTILAYPNIEFSKSNLPIEVHFVDERNRDWLIYKN